ncbi:MAG: ABC transporter ATP-binding protein [Methanomicrobia archaeon]|nr:ABC transporter ATP-binding protein [Methanomicrobia archaeon]MCK4433772.1 ABC transporter ATP-binding protein [Methanomicrobia archaeon]
MLKIDNLSVKVNGKSILKKINLEINNGEIHALLGPNASGKSSLVYAMMGFPDYNVTDGKIIFNGKDITDLQIEERVKLGISSVFQHPPSIKGVKLSKLLDKVSKKRIELKELNDLLEREINVGFSGGERKLSEIVQVISLDPSFVIFDELDAGLDVENLERLTSLIKSELDNKSILLITHRGRILRFLKPNIVHVMIDGKIVCSSEDWKRIWETIEVYGYEKCKECELRSNRS